MVQIFLRPILQLIHGNRNQINYYGEINMLVEIRKIDKEDVTVVTSLDVAETF